MQRLWLAVARFAARRVILGRRIPDGLPQHRSETARCDHYWPRDRSGGTGIAACRGDGHYLCAECWYHDDSEENLP